MKAILAHCYNVLKIQFVLIVTSPQYKPPSMYPLLAYGILDCPDN